jgi:hypothetical protein
MWKVVLLRQVLFLLCLMGLVGGGFAAYKWGWNRGTAASAPTLGGSLPGDPLREKVQALKGLEASLPKLVKGLTAQAKRVDEQAKAEEELKKLLEEVKEMGEKLAPAPPSLPTPSTLPSP